MLIDGVSSPGGTTIAALEALEAGGVRAAFAEAVAANVRALEGAGLVSGAAARDAIVDAIGQFYGLLIFVYVLMSWFPMRGILYDIYRVLGSVVEPYLGLFRSLIPPMGNFDFSPLVAYFVLQMVVNYVLVPLALKL